MVALRTKNVLISAEINAWPRPTCSCQHIPAPNQRNHGLDNYTHIRMCNEWSFEGLQEMREPLERLGSESSRMKDWIKALKKVVPTAVGLQTTTFCAFDTELPSA
ncbi:hypothetical protein M8C21_010597, partial [Ambrosia artemisiifolia]